jgi:hypothetical protein
VFVPNKVQTRQNWRKLHFKPNMFLPTAVFHVNPDFLYIYIYTHIHIYIYMHSFNSLSYDRSKASSKASSPRSAIQSFLLQMRLSSPFLKVIQYIYIYMCVCVCVCVCMCVCVVVIDREFHFSVPKYETPLTVHSPFQTNL